MFNHDSIYAKWYAHAPIEYPPVLPIPGDTNRQVSMNPMLSWPPHPLPSYMGQTFTWLRKFWTIFQEINLVYSLDIDTPIVERAPLAFAESKYQQLLDWTNMLGQDMLCGQYNQSHVFIFQ